MKKLAREQIFKTDPQPTPETRGPAGGRSKVDALYGDLCVDERQFCVDGFIA
jgi:hypothetical protein